MKKVRAWSVVVLLAAAGCGGGGGSSSTVADFCSQYATNMCGIASTCGIQPTACVTYQTSQCMTFANAAVASGKRMYTPGNTSNCLNKIKAAYTGAKVVTPADQAAIDLACNYVFQGKAAVLTGACTTQFDCAGATDGSIICDPTAKLCAMKTTVNSGAQCSAVGAVCAQDSYCAANSAGVLLCAPAAKMGESCATVPCDHNTRCVNGLCAALAQTGETCSSNSDCVSTAPYCNPYVSPPICNAGLGFAVGAPSCSCVAQGTSCPSPSTTGTGGTGGHATGTAGAGGGGTAGAAGGAGGQGTAGSAGTAGTAGAAGAAGGAGGQGGDLPGVGGLGGI